MKTLAVMMVVASACVAGYSQGSVQFQNGVTSRIEMVVGGVTNKVTSATIGAQSGNGSAGIVDVGLVWGSSADTVNNLAAVVNISSFAGITAGNFLQDLPGTNPGDTDYLQIYAWDSSFGNTLAGMQACIAAGGFFGAASGVPGEYGSVGTALAFTLGAPQGPGTVIYGTLPGYFGPTAGAFNGMVVMAAPEPGTIALGVIGAAALLLRRRK